MNFVHCLAVVLLFASSLANAQPRIQLLDADPASPATLGHWEQLYLRIGYETDRPIRVRAEAYSGGKLVTEITSGSPRYEAGQGEAMFWFAFTRPQKVDRVVMFCGPRDQLETWQGLPSATPANRFFGFSHVLDTGWSGDHYCRSWELLGLHQFGPIVNVDKVKTPYGSTRRLITDADVKNDAKKAHSSVV